MRRFTLTLCLLLLLTDACDESTIDLSTAASVSPRSISLVADSAVTALDSSLVNTVPHYRCTMGLLVRGSSTISGETAVWTGGSYRLVESGTTAPPVRLTAAELTGWFGSDRVGPGESVATTRVFESAHRFTAVDISITVDLMVEGERPGRPHELSTSFGCG